MEKNGTAVLRTNYDLDDNDFYEIGNQVIENTQDEDLKGFYWMGVIYLEKLIEMKEEEKSYEEKC